MATKKGKSVTDWENAADSSTPTVFYRTLNVEGLEIFYREAGPRGAPTLGSLAGSRMWQAFGWSGVCALGLVATVGATPPLVTALAHGAGSQTAPVKKQK